MGIRANPWGTFKTALNFKVQSLLHQDLKAHIANIKKNIYPPPQGLYIVYI